MLPGTVFVHPHQPGTPERLHAEGGWPARILAGRCPCGIGFRTDAQLIRPGGE